MPDVTPTPKDIAPRVVKRDNAVIEKMCPWALVRRHPEGGYAVVHGFVEDTHIPEVDPDVHDNFVTLQAAADEAAKEGYFSPHPEIFKPAGKLVRGL